MNWDAVGAIGEIVGAFAVFATLIYLAIQIRQSTTLTRAQIAHDAWIQSGQEQLSQIGSDPSSVLAKALLSTESLTDEDIISIDHYYQNLCAHINRIEYTNKLGLELYTHELTALVYSPFFKEGIGLTWWNQNREEMSITAPNISARMDQLIKSDNVVSIQDKLLKLKSAANSERS